jgi:hypothetical protein
MWLVMDQGSRSGPGRACLVLLLLLDRQRRSGIHPMVCVIIENKRLLFKADELKTVIHPDSESGLYCQQLNNRDSKSTVAEKLLFSPKNRGVYIGQSKYRFLDHVIE